MKRTFVFLVTALTHSQLSYSGTDTSVLPNISQLPADLVPETTHQSEPSASLLHAQLKIRQGILIASETSGAIKRLPLRNGQHFVAGQVLASLDCPKEQSRLKKATAELNHQATLKKQLEASYSINTLEIDSVNAEYAIAQADAHIAKALVERCVVYAPFAGKVVKLLAKSSQVIRTGDSLMEIVDNNQEVELLVNANKIPLMKVGQHYLVNRDKTSTHPYNIEMTSLGGRVDTGNQMIKMYGRITENVAAALPNRDSVVAFLNQAH